MSAFGGKVNTSVRKSAAAKLIDRKKFCELMPPTTLATGDSRASSSQGSPTSPRGVNQPAFTSCVCEGADKLAALQPNFKRLSSQSTHLSLARGYPFRRQLTLAAVASRRRDPLAVSRFLRRKRLSQRSEVKLPRDLYRRDS